MTALLPTLSFLAVIVVLVLAHEIGHFVTAKAKGVTVQEFGLFLPPRLFSIKRGETIYSINAIPLGGFVKMAGEEDPTAPGSLASKSIGTRLLVLSSGAIMNLLLPVFLFSIAFMVPHDTLKGLVVVEDVAPNSPASAAGVRPGDTILSLNNQPVDSSIDIHRSIDLNLGRQITLLVRHVDGAEETVRLTPRWKPPEDQGAVGVLLRNSEATIVRKSEPFWRAIPMGVTASIETFVLFKNGIVSMIIGTIPAQVTGPVGIAQMTGEIARIGFSPLLEFAAFLSINLGIINIFPLPALDGGRIAFVLLEWLRRGKRISVKAETRVHAIGFVLLMAFFLAVTYKDILRIING
ncbi:MAG: RIP metalloprotease RseP [Chloroflexi bacterium RBG_16_51_9]|nr:MAG: RIP metalloprotease RseP [Chloroflexi bacterium RBG_16_51_9]